jgi:hypothetical protein
MQFPLHKALPKVLGGVLATNTGLPQVRVHPGPRHAPHAVTDSFGEALGGRPWEGSQQQAPPFYRAGTNLSCRELQVGR